MAVAGSIRTLAGSERTLFSVNLILVRFLYYLIVSSRTNLSLFSSYLEFI